MENLEVCFSCSGQKPRLALLEKAPIHCKGEEGSRAGEVQKGTFNLYVDTAIATDKFNSFWKIWSNV